jgi:glycosyltransferase involved in cell wall biosynthesis
VHSLCVAREFDSHLALQRNGFINIATNVDLMLVHMPKQALVVSYSKIYSDPRVLRQINWLKEFGYEVTTLGLGEAPFESIKTHYEIHVRSLFFRLVSYLVFNGERRYSMLFKRINQHILKTFNSNHKFDVVVFNDLDLLPLAAEIAHAQSLLYPKAHFHLDLHEYFLDHGIGFVWRVLFKKYASWLQQQIDPKLWDSVSTVSPSIAKLYEDSKIFDNVASVLSTPKKESLPVKRCSESEIHLVYHGTVDFSRGLLELVDIIQHLDNKFHLNLVLVGSASKIAKLRNRAKKYSHRIHFWDPVPTKDIAKLINKFDIEVIFYVPTSLNLLHALPNKYFEAVQANLAIIHGKSPSMQAMSNRYGNGITVDSWTFEALADSLNNLSVHDIDSCKMKSSNARLELCSEMEAFRFMELIAGNQK